MAAMPALRLTPGDPAPWFRAREATNPRFEFSTVAGRYVVLSFLGSSTVPAARRMLEGVAAHRHLFDDEQACFFGVSIDPEDDGPGRLERMIPGIRFFLDTDRAVSALYGACDPAAAPSARVSYHPHTLVLDPALRILAVVPLADVADPFEPVREALERLPRIGPARLVQPQAPVLVVPGIFEPAFCRRLIDAYETHGGEDSGFMRDVDGKTVSITDYGFKRRADHALSDKGLREQARARVLRRLVPEIHRAFQFRATRMERYIVACYEAEPGGYFRPHRDNTTAGTAHRRFAVTINLNAEEYEGGNLRFPEYGPHAYRAPTGGAVVFSCSLLHEALPVTRGRRFAFLPFLYDEDAARQREANNAHLGPGVGAYHAGIEKGAAPG